MGWLWASSSEGAAKEQLPTNSQNAPLATPTPPSRDFSLTEEQRMRIFGRPGPDTSASPDAKPDDELEDFLRNLEAPGSAVGGAALSTQKPERVDDDGRRTMADGSIDISPAALYPRSMSCRQAFDQAFYCQSMGGKFNDIYRYGHLQSCSESWSAFWFCMRIRTMPGKDKEHLIANFYKEREEKKKKEYGSSEDIWDLRTKAIEKAFGKDPEAPDAGEERIAVKE